MWDEMKRANIRAYEVSVEWQERTRRPLRDRDYHAHQWLFDAHIALDEIEKAREQLEELKKLRAPARDRSESMGDMPWLIRYFRRTLQRED